LTAPHAPSNRAVRSCWDLQLQRRPNKVSSRHGQMIKTLICGTVKHQHPSPIMSTTASAVQRKLLELKLAVAAFVAEERQEVARIYS
jgi:hypothetical protein